MKQDGKPDPNVDEGEVGDAARWRHTGPTVAPGTMYASLVEIGADGWVLVALGHFRPATVAELALRAYIDVQRKKHHSFLGCYPTGHLSGQKGKAAARRALK